MKKIPLLLLCLAFIATAYAQHPIHQYIIHFYPTSFGGDKPLDEVTIKYGDSTMVQLDDFKAVIVTDAVTLETVLSYTRGNIKSHVKAANRDFGSYGVMVNAQTALVTHYYLNSHTESTTYFKRLVDLLSTKHADQNVIDELQKIVNRVNY